MKASSNWFQVEDSDRIKGGQSNKEDMYAYLQYLEEALDINELDAWHRVSLNQILELGGAPGEFYHKG